MPVDSDTGGPTHILGIQINQKELTTKTFMMNIDYRYRRLINRHDILLYHLKP